MKNVCRLFIDTMLNNNGPNIGDGLNFVTCEQAFIRSRFWKFFPKTQWKQQRFGVGLRVCGWAIKPLYQWKIKTRMHTIIIYYRPQTKFAKVMFFIPVCHSVHGGGVCLSACWDTHPPGQTHPWADPPGQTPLGQTPLGQTHPWSRHPPPPGRHPLGRNPAGQTPPWADTPLHSACWEIRATNGRYASYWNAFLFILFLTHLHKL